MASDLEALLEALSAARADLLAALDGITQEAFVARPPSDDLEARTNIRDLLWRVGAFDDWTRLVLDQALDGRPTAAWAPRLRPAYLNTPELLLAWLEQTRGALLARARRLDDTELNRELALHEGGTTPRALLRRPAELDGESTRRVGTLRATSG